MKMDVMNEQIADQSPLDRGFTRYQSLLVALLALVQFTVILDFTIMSPLGALIMPAFGDERFYPMWRERLAPCEVITSKVIVL